MPRYRRMSRPRAPKPPKQARVKRPATGELRKIYDGLVATDIGQRMAALNAAMQWYDTLALPYVLFKSTGSYTVEQAKDMDVASKCRLKGMSTHSNNEKENAYRLALKRYEKICSVLNPPLVEEYYKDLDDNSTKLKEKQERLEERFGHLTQMLTKALKPVNIQGQPIEVQVGQVKDEYRADPARSQLTLRRDIAKNLRVQMRQDGFLAVAKTIIEPLSRLAALKPEVDPATNQPTGRYVMTYQDRFEQTMKMLGNLIAWGKTDEAPKRLVRPTALVVPGIPGSTPPVKRVGGFGRLTKGPKVAGLFIAGTAAAKLYLQIMDGEWHDIAELQKSILPTKIDTRFRVIDIEGKKSLSRKGEGWHIERDSKRCRLVFSSTAYQQTIQQASMAAAGQP